jgi:DNA gyrase inhibitor GyrI
MTHLEVKLIDLDSMHVVVATGYGPDPENEAWGDILDFARQQDLDPWDQTHRFFGFNNPNPEPTTVDYGYEQWMTVPSEMMARPPLMTKDVDGGRYAMVRIHGLDTIGESWRYLARWCEEQGYRIDSDRDPCLEELLTPIDYSPSDWEMNLYLALTN